MNTALRPMSLGEILDRVAQLYRENFLLFAGIFSFQAGASLVLNLITYGLQYWGLKGHGAHPLIWPSMVSSGVTLLVLFLFFGATGAAICRAVAWVNLGKPATILDAYKAVLQRLGRYLGLMILTALIVWTPIVFLYAGFFGALFHYTKGFAGAFSGHPIAAQQPDPATFMTLGIIGIVFVILLIPALVYTILMALRYSLALPVCVVEDLPATAALRRSAKLSKGSRGRVFVLLLLVAAIRIGFTLLTQLFVFIFAFKHPGQPLSPITATISQIIAFFTDTFIGPIAAIGLTLFYYDQRIRNEGFDVEWMIQAAGLDASSPEAQAAYANMQPYQPWGQPTDTRAFVPPPQWTPPNPYDYSPSPTQGQQAGSPILNAQEPPVINPPESSYE